jgi:hypothetical protein
MFLFLFAFSIFAIVAEMNPNPTICGKSEDSTSRAIPPAGTRVMLLYANDRAVIML